MLKCSESESGPTHLVDCVTFGADFGRFKLQPAKQQCGCHGLKRRHSDLFPPSRNTNRDSEASCYTIEQYVNRLDVDVQSSADISDVSDPELSVDQCVAKEDRMCTCSTLLCKRAHL